MAQQPTEICDNCLKPFPESKIATHFGYCRRNIKKCPTCNEMYDINFQEEHQEEFHKMANCKYCKKQLKPQEITKHQDNCDARTKYCEYCDLDVPMKDYPSHLRNCQARTKQCDKCRKPIANKDYLIHQISCPGFVQEVKPSISTGNQYSDYQAYLKDQKRKEESKVNEYKPSYQEPKRESSRQREVRDLRSEGYSKNIYTNNNGLRQAEIKKEAIIPNKPGTKPPTTNYADIKMNKNAVNYGDQRILASNIHEKDLKPKVEIGSYKYIETNKIGSGKIIQNKYVPSIVPPQRRPNEVKPSGNTYGSSKDVPRTGVQPSSNNARVYQPPQMDVNHRPSQNVPSSNYPKVSEPYKKQVISSKEIVYGRKEEKPKDGAYRVVYEYKRQEHREEPRREEPRRPNEPARHNQPQRNMPRTNVMPSNEYNLYQPSSYQEYVPAQTPGISEHEMDEQLQQAIMESWGGVSISSPKQPGKSLKPSYKIDDVPLDLLESDMINESFYGKQQAIMEEIEKNKKRR